MKVPRWTVCLAFGTLLCAAADRVKIENGLLESTTPAESGVRAFKGIPFGQPPVGDLRWKEPQPVRNWTGVRNADQFGPRCMQRTAPNADYWFRSNGMSEDCLYLNVWTPAKSGREHLPVLVYIFGGGFQNGDGSEPRYDGASMASKGMVAVSVNYRLNVFGFFSHPELTKESPHHASGNYGLLDQAAALAWVKRNIAAFGGDPARVTIAGESAGSISVSALMGSPLSRGLIAGAIGESGALISTLPPRPLADTEQDGVKFGGAAGATTLSALRAMPAEQIQEVLAKGGPGIRFSPNLDGYFLPKPLPEILEAGEQAKIPLLAGSNSEEMPARMVLGQAEPTPENFAAAVRKLYGERADAVLAAYAPKTTDEVLETATHLACARFISLGTWKWTELQMRTGGKPVYRYFYTRIRPKYTPMNPPAESPAPAAPGRGGPPSPPRGAAHSAEIQYAMGNLKLDPRYAWDPADYKVSETMQAYFVNFIKTGNPNGAGVPEWPAYSPATNYQRMRIDVASKAEPEPDRARYLSLDPPAGKN
ncbi:MAG TPA: carboxylesterase family protein [Candidatus Acidoferrales bacterium]|nr:carboxylesterase family protein [Candidatus Acidoferrales bacterium]